MTSPPEDRPDPAAAPERPELTVLPVVPAATSAAADKESFTYYELVGGEPTFRALVHHFYAGVADDPVLRPLYPEADLGPAEERLRLFLIQYWGGPTTYSDQRGHPRLRMRHVRFAIGARERDAWLARMHDAVDAIGLTARQREILLEYLTMAAHGLVNRPD